MDPRDQNSQNVTRSGVPIYKEATVGRLKAEWVDPRTVKKSKKHLYTKLIFLAAVILGLVTFYLLNSSTHQL